MSDRNPKSLSTLKAGGKSTAIIPQTFEDVQRIANMAVGAGLGSFAWNDTDEQKRAKAVAAIMHGMELGLSPMQALGGIAVINGKTTIYGDLLTAVLWANGFKVKKWVDGEGDNRVARARITRPDGEVIEDKFSVAQAKQARLWDTRETVKKKAKGGGEYMAPNDSAWFRFPEDMLGWKALGRCVRSGASDVTRGLTLREDMDNPIVDITPDPPAASSDDIPEIPAAPADDIPELPEDEVVSEIHATAAEPIADANGLLAKLKDEFDGQDDEAIRLEIWEAHADLIERLSAADQRRAQAIYEGRA